MGRLGVLAVWAGRFPARITGISDRAKEILGSIDFYKVGHHGSTNATPIPAVAAPVDNGSAAMCSTATGASGNPAKRTGIPARTALMDALESQTGNRMVRSDWITPAHRNPIRRRKRNSRTCARAFPPGRFTSTTRCR